MKNRSINFYMGIYMVPALILSLMLVPFINAFAAVMGLPLIGPVLCGVSGWFFGFCAVKLAQFTQWKLSDEK